MPILSGILGQMDGELKKMPSGRVLDISSLSKNDVDKIEAFYKESNCVVIGSGKDKYNFGKYFVSLIKSGGITNA